MKKTLFVGCVEGSYILLKHLLQYGYIVSGIITKDESTENADFHSLKTLADEYGITYYCAKDINDTDTIAFVKTINPDVIYCFGWSRLIGRELLSLPSYGVIGFHPAALPNNRGRHPLIWALALGLEKTASTFFIMDENADTGDIISQKEVYINFEDDAQSLYSKIMETAKDQVVEFTKAIENNTLSRMAQDKSSGNTWRKRGEPDGRIDWRMSCIAIYNLVRALTHPYVGSHFIHEGKMIKVWKCKPVICDEYSNIEPGKVITVKSDTSFVVKAYDGVVEILDSERVNLKEGEYL